MNMRSNNMQLNHLIKDDHIASIFFKYNTSIKTRIECATCSSILLTLRKGGSLLHMMFSDHSSDIFQLFLQDASEEYLNTEANRPSGIVEISTTSAILFVVIASCFLVMLYKLMSYWFIEVLVVLFCIGGVEVCSTSHYKDYFFTCLHFTFSV